MLFACFVCVFACVEIWGGGCLVFVCPMGCCGAVAGVGVGSGGLTFLSVCPFR